MVNAVIPWGKNTISEEFAKLLLKLVVLPCAMSLILLGTFSFTPRVP